MPLRLDEHMNKAEPPDQEPRAVVAPTEIVPVYKGRRSLSRVRRELTDEELSSTAVQKLLLDELDRLETERGELLDYREKYYAAEGRASVLEERERRSLAFEVLSSACFVLGAAAIGYAPALWHDQPAGWLALVFGFLLIGGGIWAKTVRK